LSQPQGPSKILSNSHLNHSAIAWKSLFMGAIVRLGQADYQFDNA
jgi:hypothetical protein